MGRFIALLAFIAAVIGVIWGLTLIARYFKARQRQRLAAQFAPELLRYENLPKEVVEAFIAQRKQLDDAQTILQKLMNDPYFTLTTDYHNLINRWLGQQKEITQ